jgi:hypothetical protein
VLALGARCRRFESCHPDQKSWSPTSLYAFFIGAVLGLIGFATPSALLVLTMALSIRAVADMKWERLPVLGWPSAYTVYCYNLEQRGEPTHYAWISYVVQLFAFGLLFGWAAYTLASYIR